MTKRENHIWHGTTLMLSAMAAVVTLLLSNPLPVEALENNVNITGNLVQEPCTLDPQTSDIPMDFGNVVSKFFASSSRTPGMPFVIRLKDCDLTIGRQATVTFTGTESQAQPGLLLPDDGDTHGFAFGIETDATEPVAVPLNQASPVFDLDDSQKDTELHLRGYIQANPDVVNGQGIKAGPFTGTATFEVAYP